jgi:hypothetical protein
VFFRVLVWWLWVVFILGPCVLPSFSVVTLCCFHFRSMCKKRKELVVLQKIKRKSKLETIEQHKVTTLKLGRTHGPSIAFYCRWAFVVWKVRYNNSTNINNTNNHLWPQTIEHNNNKLHNLCWWNIHKPLIHHLSIGGWFKRMELIEVKSLIWAQKGKLYIIYENVM